MAEKARTPMSGAEREAKYAAKMKEKDYETWCAKNREEMRKCIESMSEQKRKEMRRRDAERKREKRAAEKLKRNGGEYKTQANISRCLVKIRSRCIHSRAPLQARSTDSSVIICTVFGPI